MADPKSQNYKGFPMGKVLTSASIIAIDGPAASGKSTLAKRLAEALDYLYFDTGVMYRAVAWKAHELLIKMNDEAAIVSLAERVKIDVRPPSEEDNRDSDVLIDGEDITWPIRSPQVDASVSIVAAYSGVRQALTAQQRRIGLRGQVVMVGRDIGTIVLPEADLKIYLDASMGERARRRFEESAARGDEVQFDVVLISMERRDNLDSTRAVAPLRPAEGAVIIDSDGLTAEQVFQNVLDLLPK
jgi:cytidylate kinase